MSWPGCAQQGRQGLMVRAERYSSLFFRRAITRLETHCEESMRSMMSCLSKLRSSADTSSRTANGRRRKPCDTRRTDWSTCGAWQYPVTTLKSVNRDGYCAIWGSVMMLTCSDWLYSPRRDTRSLTHFCTRYTNLTKKEKCSYCTMVLNRSLCHVTHFQPIWYLLKKLAYITI